jgi:hypothetical protein
MNIRLGNLSVEEMEKRSGVTFPDELKQLLNKTHQEHATNIALGEWHCFDLPFVIVCGGMPLAQEIYDHLKDMTSQFKEPLQIALA